MMLAMRDNIKAQNDAPFLSFGGSIDEFVVSLSLYGDDLDPDAVTEALGIQPTRSFRKGDRRHPESTYRVPIGSWSLSMRGFAPEEIEAKIMEVLDSFPSDLTAWRHLCETYKPALRLGLFLDTWNRGFDLSPRLLARLANFGVSLVLDIYGPATGVELSDSFDGI